MFLLDQTDFNNLEHFCFHGDLLYIPKSDLSNCFKLEKLKITHSTDLGRGCCDSVGAMCFSFCPWYDFSMK